MTIKQLSKMNIIYMRRTGAYGIENKHLMEDFKQWLNRNNLFNSESVILAIPRDNPQTTDPQNCRYDVALVVESLDTIKQSDVKKGTLASGKYACFIVEHTEEAISQIMQNFAHEIENKGYTFNPQQPIIERYAVNMVENNQCELYIPVL